MGFRRCFGVLFTGGFWIVCGFGVFLVCGLVVWCMACRFCGFAWWWKFGGEVCWLVVALFWLVLGFAYFLAWVCSGIGFDHL